MFIVDVASCNENVIECKMFCEASLKGFWQAHIHTHTLLSSSGSHTHTVTLTDRIRSRILEPQQKRTDTCHKTQSRGTRDEGSRADRVRGRDKSRGCWDKRTQDQAPRTKDKRRVAGCSRTTLAELMHFVAHKNTHTNTPTRKKEGRT